MANIQDYLTKILKERYGKDVRQSIHDAIQQCYLDGKAGSIDLQARESIEALESEKLDKSGDTANNITVFSSGDNLSPTGWANIEKIESGETHANLFRKFSLAIKNLRYLYKMIGTADISAIGDGTIKGAISGLNNGLSSKIALKTKVITGRTSALGLTESLLDDNQIFMTCEMVMPGNNYYLSPAPFNKSKCFSLYNSADIQKGIYIDTDYLGTIWYLEITI